jgi:hypothetical protein
VYSYVRQRTSLLAVIVAVRQLLQPFGVIWSGAVRRPFLKEWAVWCAFLYELHFTVNVVHDVFEEIRVRRPSPTKSLHYLSYICTIPGTLTVRTHQGISFTNECQASPSIRKHQALESIKHQASLVSGLVRMYLVLVLYKCHRQNSTVQRDSSASNTRTKEIAGWDLKTHHH